jgi:UDP-GlcNAc:undecaprenyl-phosphate/decaprenyl-phosphate GlcNAc-1-phosphate transferase
MESIISNSVLGPAIVSFAATLISTPLLIPMLKKLGIMDDPKMRKHPAVIHKKPVPRGGGIPLFIGVIIAALIFIPMTKIIGAILLAAFIALVVGTLDDKYDISPYARFVINIVCALIVVGAGVNVPFITNPFGGILYLSEFRYPFDVFGIQSAIVLSDLVAILWIVWVMNMLNWSKGVDGQMPGIVAISAVFIGILSMRFGMGDPLTSATTALSFITAGAAIAFLIFNFHPARIFPGYGATAIYLLLAVVSILSSAKLATAILVMGVPLADGAFTILRRLITGHSPFWHDKKHLHHLLLSTGAGQRQIALFYWLLSAIFGSLSLVLSSRGKIFAIIMLVIIVGGALLFLNYFIHKKNGSQSL